MLPYSRLLPSLWKREGIARTDFLLQPLCSRRCQFENIYIFSNVWLIVTGRLYEELKFSPVSLSLRKLLRLRRGHHGRRLRERARIRAEWAGSEAGLLGKN